jgi:hypothetical protein
MKKKDLKLSIVPTKHQLLIDPSPDKKKIKTTRKKDYIIYIDYD